MNYPLDTTGQSHKNTVIGDIVQLQVYPDNGILNLFPSHTPFYWEGVKVKHTDASGVSKVLIQGQDFTPGFQYIDATAKTNRLICGSLVFADTTLTGTVTLCYQCLGGAFEIPPQTLANIRTDEGRDPTFTTFEDLCKAVSFVLADFPVVAYPWSTMEDTQLSKTLEFLERNGLVAHIRPSFLSEPSQTVFIPTKQEVGLGDVENYPMATTEQAIDGVEQQAYMSPKLVKDSVSSLIAQQLGVLGYKIPTPYTSGQYIKDEGYTVQSGNDVYAVRPEALPFTTTGNFNRDKENLILVSSTDRDHWHSYTYTITGFEPLEEINGGIVIDTKLKFSTDIRSIIILNYIGELIRTIDYNLDDGKIYLYHPVGSGDMLSFLYKRKSSQLSDDRPFYKEFKIVDGNRSFTLPGFDFMQPDDVRVTMNSITILTRVVDYEIVNANLITNFPLKLGDTLEVMSNDAVPPLGVLQSRLMLSSDR